MKTNRFKDQTGRVVSLPAMPQRIVSLVPSQTELLFDLGLGDRVVGVTKFCIHPDDARTRAKVVGGTKGLKAERIVALQPDLVIANKEENEAETIFSLQKELPVWVSDVRDLTGALDMIKEVGKLTNKFAESNDLLSDISSRFALLEQGEKRLRTAYLIWDKPMMTVGGDTFIHDMMDKAGFENVFGYQRRYPEIDLEELKKQGVECVLLSSEPFPFNEKHANSMKEQLPDVRVLVVDGEMFSWYGSRMAKAPAYFSQLQGRTRL